MELEELLRQGIAEAQEASTSQVRRERLHHVQLARSFLTAALRRYGRGEQGGSPEVCAHLLAVLLKLGEDARCVQGILAECGAGLFSRAAPAHLTGSAGSGAPRGSGELTPEGRLTPSEHSSADDEPPAKLWDYDEMKENFLAEDSSDEEKDMPATSPGGIILAPDPQLDGSPAPSPAFSVASLGTASEGVRLRHVTLSPVQERDDHDDQGHGHHSNLPPSPATPMDVGSVAAPTPEAGSSPWVAAALELDAEAATQESPQFRSDRGHIISGGYDARAVNSTRPSPLANALRLCPASPSRFSHVRSAVDDAAAAAATTFEWPNSRGTASESQPQSPAMSSSSSRRATLQPQQAGGALAGKRRQGRNNSLQTPSSAVSETVTSSSTSNLTSMLASTTATSQAATSDLTPAGQRIPQDSLGPSIPGPRQKRRQPSQSSSSGSQNASDSETGAVKRNTFAGTIKESINEEGADDGQKWSTHPTTPSESPGAIHAANTSAVVSAGVRRSHRRQPSGQSDCFSTPGVPAASPGGTWDTLSLAGSYAPSKAHSPFAAAAVCRAGWLTPPANATAPSNSLEKAPDWSSDLLSVRILNGVSGEEEVRFNASLKACSAEAPLFLAMLDRLCLEHAGQPLAGLNWLSREGDARDRFERRKCDARMADELFHEWQDLGKEAVLLLCTIPVTPPSELLPSKARLKVITPARVAIGDPSPVRLQLDTSILEEGHEYSVAFTHQWTNMTYSAEANLMKNSKGVEVTVPWQMLTLTSSSTADGLYDVHLVIDQTRRSENRRTLTVGSSESEMSSSSATKSEATSSFVPIGRTGSD
eukprot:TRINITY_DN43134_c0_g1_i1.p1 TRINITY_DN43134_c0_g1~~TRINITY_DN43134_c0_g1_i1.p1  ORF type:complete len:880 (-),score=131.82 TRINITY_DN43134_c0_g1_i1:79-2538(-)